MLTLSEVPVGQAVTVQDIADLDMAAQAIRMGISAGETVTCVARVPAGPTVIRRGGMEVALGRELCQNITVVAV